MGQKVFIRRVQAVHGEFAFYSRTNMGNLFDIVCFFTGVHAVVQGLRLRRRVRSAHRHGEDQVRGPRRSRGPGQAAAREVAHATGRERKGQNRGRRALRRRADPGEFICISVWAISMTPRVLFYRRISTRSTCTTCTCRR